MNNPRSWLSQGGNLGDFVDVTFIRKGLAITNLRAPNQPDILKKHGIRSILSLFQPGTSDIDISDASKDWAPVQSLMPVENLIGEGETPHPRLVEAGVHRRIIHPLSDDDKNDSSMLIRAVELLEELHSTLAPVLVHCRMGASRSPAVVACYLAKSEGLTFRKAVEEIARLRPVAICDGIALTIAEANGVVVE